MHFRHERIDDAPPSGRNVVCVAADLTGNGRDDIIIGGSEGSPTLYWYETPGWTRHPMANPTALESGGALADLTGNGRQDLIAGAPRGETANEAYWFEQPADPRDEWTQRLLVDDYHKYHDQAVGDIDDDGDPEVVMLSQDAEVIFYYDIPTDPTLEPWPDDHRHIIAEGRGDVEGLAILDIDGDGKTELVAGRHVFHRTDPDEWTYTRVAPDWEDERVRVGVADLDDDGDQEIVLTECELPPLGERHDIVHDARLGICAPPDWSPDVLRDDLWCPHTLQLADFTGDGTIDLYVAESGFRGHENPRHFVYRNRGDGTFEEQLVHEGTPVHEAKVADLTGTGSRDIVGKNDGADGHVDVWYNEA